MGKFEHDSVAWIRTVPAPAFKVFNYSTGYKERVPRGKVELAFESYEEDEVPSTGMVSLAAKVMANLEQLAPKIIESLWDDLNGRGPNSGMWWHGKQGDPEELMGNSHEDPPQRKEDLLRLMRPYQVLVHKRLDDYAKPIAEINFRAAFEEEHGVCVLTDGTKILGHGYAGDASPFDRK